MKLGYVEQIKDIKDEIRSWIITNDIDIFLNMLQAIRLKEIGFFSNSFLTMGLKELQEKIKAKLDIKVGLHYKAIFYR